MSDSDDTIGPEDKAPLPEQLPEGVESISILEEMQRSYLDYAMSVIVSRALPDVRDGMKPVHRRILYAMHDMKLEWNKGYRKAAGVVGEVMGKYHPHGDSAIYDALVRMAQDWSLRSPLIDGQGNFGSIDGDPPAAMRYTECRLEKITHTLLEDIDKETVAFQDNYDGRETEPSVLPARFPNLLVNGSGGIAVGMATNIPPHNLSEVINGCMALIDRPEMSLAELSEIIPGPDFPTGGLILGRSGIASAYETGRGSIVMRGVARIEDIKNDKQAIIITEIPYQVNKASLIEKIAELVRDKRIEGIADIRDESDRDGYRVVVETKRDGNADVILNQLYRFTQLQTSFGANMVALNGGKPEQLTLIEMLKAFSSFREEVVQKRTKFLLRKARDRAHVLVGLAIAVANIDEVIHTIRNAPTPSDAREQLMQRAWPAGDVAPLVELISDPRHRLNEDNTYNLSEAQARAILELRLQRLTALGRDEIADELNTIGAEIKEFLAILASRARILEIVKNELISLRDEYGTPRRTELTHGGPDMDDEDLIAREDMVVTVSHAGYIKRVPLSTYRAQRRGGKGRSGMTTRDEDFVTRLFVLNTHTPVLFFSSRGIVYKLKAWRLPLAQPQSRGKALINLLPLEQGERITTIMPLPEEEGAAQTLEILFATRKGTVRRNSLADFVQVNRNGKIAMKLDDEEDAIVGVEVARADQDVLLATAKGQAIRFPVGDLRVFASRNSMGVRGINLADGDHVISMCVVDGFDATTEERDEYIRLSRQKRGDDSEDGSALEVEFTDTMSAERFAQMEEAEQFLLGLSVNGYGKRSSLFEYRRSGRGGKGITAMNLSARNGDLIGCFPVESQDDIMLVSDGGKLIRVPVSGIRIAGRSTQGVTVFSTAEAENVVSVERISDPSDDDEEGDDEIGAETLEGAPREDENTDEGGAQEE